MKEIEEFTKKFTDTPVTDVVKVGKSFYQADPELDRLREKIDSNINREPNVLGRFLGSLQGSKFLPGVELLDILGEDTERWIKIDDNAEWLFLCGRDLMGKSITEANTKRGMTLVKNKHNEILGYGKITELLEAKNAERICVENILDRGDFLRREMRKK